jgi:pyruvate decarboxylase
LDNAHEQIDKAVSACLKESKPVYISVSCNLAGTVHPSFTRSTIPYAIAPQ